ncbi:zinc metalloproteinase nas-39-like [Mizuhopecten yessoensis]|uniref:Cubilin n=1 Tax=Mizuhopecten yessoensis TaxID=6573 RepID=A0A210R3G5_MIZYE|nr:zinc metalloproteinase nas-39-like [Mizuhopecten yessoensis]OWF55620.1 Cubilin [Mizuhopecten yessoensis]
MMSPGRTMAGFGAGFGAPIMLLLMIITQVFGVCDIANRRVETELMATQDVEYLYSPGWRISYYSNTDCKWLINGSDTDSAFRVLVDVTYLSIENSPGCSYDGLSIYDGSSTSATLLGRICNRLPTGRMYLMTGQFAYLRLKSDSSVQATGFSLRYLKYKPTTPSTACTSTVSLTASTTLQYLTSPDFPSQQNAFDTCTWLISASSGSSTLTVNVVFLDIDGEEMLSIYDGSDNTATQLVSLSNDRTTFTDGSTVTTTGDKAYIQFSTAVMDSVRLGFIVSYNESSSTATTTASALTTVATTSAAPVVATTTYTAPSACDSGTITITATSGSSGYITTPDYPEFYGHNLACSWVVQASAGEQISLTAVDSSLEDSDGCSGDVVSIYDGSTTSYPLLASFCGTTYQSVNGTGTSILVVFTSDGSSSDRGFKFQYTVTAQETPTCVDSGRNITNLNATTTVQYFTSDNYPNDYTSNEDSHWLIYNPSGVGVIKVAVEDSRIEASYPCSYDKVTLYKGPCESYPVLGTFCGEEKPVYYQDTGSYVYARFVSDTDSNYKGFRVSYVLVDEVPSSTSTYLIIGAIVGGVLGAIILVAIGFAVYKGIKKYKAGKTYRTASKVSVDSDDEENHTPARKPTKGGVKLDSLLVQKKS